mmetsp:Transcript_21405/g.36771  ORF Transcript_21405/g.36771 Transcript_21405/m.36771 type:complete len:232 (+) Transcript_21405:2689-3384(+)
MYEHSVHYFLQHHSGLVSNFFVAYHHYFSHHDRQQHIDNETRNRPWPSFRNEHIPLVTLSMPEWEPFCTKTFCIRPKSNETLRCSHSGLFARIATWHERWFRPLGRLHIVRNNRPQCYRGGRLVDRRWRESDTCRCIPRDVFARIIDATVARGREPLGVAFAYRFVAAACVDAFDARWGGGVLRSHDWIVCVFSFCAWNWKDSLFFSASASSNSTGRRCSLVEGMQIDDYE